MLSNAIFGNKNTAALYASRVNPVNMNILTRQHRYVDAQQAAQYLKEMLKAKGYHVDITIARVRELYEMPNQANGYNVQRSNRPFRYQLRMHTSKRVGFAENYHTINEMVGRISQLREVVSSWGMIH